MLQEYRSRFTRALEREEIYLANHSLGRPPDQMAQDVAEALDHWYRDMDGAWGPWMERAELFCSNTARLIGWPEGGAVVPKASCGQGLRAVLSALLTPGRPLRVVASTIEFDSLDFILRAWEKRGLLQVDWVSPTSSIQGVPLFETEAYLKKVIPGVDLVIASQVVFATGQVMPGLERILAKVLDVGARSLVDAYHAVGAIPVSLKNADFAVGGSYKYLRGGPGACWLAIHPRVLESELKTLDTGWYAKKNTFAFQRTEEAEYAEGGRGWWESTPAVLPVYQARAGQEMVLEIGTERLRASSLERQQKLASLFDERGIPYVEKADYDDWGAFLLLPHTDAPTFCNKLRDKGVCVDSRIGNVRFCPDFLNDDDQLLKAADIVQSVWQLRSLFSRN